MARKRPVDATCSDSRAVARSVPRAVSFIGLVAGLAGCEGADVCEGLRTFDPPPEPDPSASAPPTVIAGEWISAGVLELSFSEPLAQNAAPDPARFAVLGWAAQVQPYDAYAGPDVCYVRTQYSVIGQGYYGSATITDVWVAPEDPTVLRMRMSSTAATCRTVPDTLADGVMLVYTNGDGGNLLLDADGDPVPDLGPAWALQQLDGCSNSYYNYCGYSLNQTSTGHLPSVTSLAMIPCP
jgi:hypothetical protein